jgi:hypothetical protein
MTSRLVRPNLRQISGNVLIVLALAAVQFRIITLNVGGNDLVSVILAMLAGALVVRRSKWTGASIIWGVLAAIIVGPASMTAGLLANPMATREGMGFWFFLVLPIYLLASVLLGLLGGALGRKSERCAKGFLARR